MTEGISANFAEKQTGKKRGKPAKFSEREIAACEAMNLFDGHRSKRGRDEVLHRQRALHHLAAVQDERLKWLFDEDAIMRGDDLKYSVLAELGRIDDQRELLTIALAVCELKPSITDAVQMIKRYRAGEAKPGESDKLTQEIIGTINRYLKRHPTSWEQVKEALSITSLIVCEKIGGSAGFVVRSESVVSTPYEKDTTK
jgi:hypothetical protein